MFSAPEFVGRSETRPGLPPFASALVTLYSLAHQWKPVNVPSALHTADDPTPLTTPKISWFPGLVLTAAQFIFARVSHRGLFRRSTIPRSIDQVCMCVCVRGSGRSCTLSSSSSTRLHITTLVTSRASCSSQ